MSRYGKAFSEKDFAALEMRQLKSRVDRKEKVRLQLLKEEIAKKRGAPPKRKPSTSDGAKAVYTPPNEARRASAPTPKIPLKSIGKYFIEQTLKSHDMKFEKETKFLSDRKFRFDYSFVHDTVLYGVEYEGIFAAKSRHTNLKGYSNDTIKYNLAALNGWRVLRYTAKTYKDFATHLKMILL